MRPAALSTLSGSPSVAAAALSTLAHLSLLGLLLVGASAPSAPPAAHLTVEVVSLPAGAPGSAPSQVAAASAAASATEVALTAPVATSQTETDLVEAVQAAALQKATALPVEAAAMPDAGSETPVPAEAVEAIATALVVIEAELVPPDPEIANTDVTVAEATVAETVAAEAVGERPPPLPPRRPTPPAPPVTAAAPTETPAPVQLSTRQPALSAAARSASQNGVRGEGEAGEAAAASAPGGPSQGAELRPGGNPAPRYPQEARRRGQQGEVVLRVTITPVGEARRVRVLRSSGYDRLDEAAREAVTRWRFEPARRAGRPVEGLLDIPVVFRLEQS